MTKEYTLTISDKYNKTYFFNELSSNLKRMFACEYLRDAKFVESKDTVIKIGKAAFKLSNPNDFFDFSTMKIVEVNIDVEDFPSFNINKIIKE